MYAYVNGDPINFNDPDGLDCNDVTLSGWDGIPNGMTVKAGEVRDPLVTAIGQDAVEAGLLGAGVGGGQVVVGPGGDQPVGGQHGALRCFPLPLFQLEAAGRDPGFKLDSTSLHKCDG